VIGRFDDDIGIDHGFLRAQGISVNFSVQPDTFAYSVSQVGYGRVAAAISNRPKGPGSADVSANQWFRCLRLILIAFALSVLGCAQMTTSDSESRKSAATEAPNETPLNGSTNVIHVVPIDGIGGPLRLVLADAVAASLRDTERPAVLAGTLNNKGPSIVGKVANVRVRGTVVWVTTNWSLQAPFGTKVAERTREIVVDKTYWDRNSVEVVNLIVGDAMPAVAAMVQDHVGPLHVAQQVIDEPRTTDLRGVDPTPSTPPEPALQRSLPELPELPDEAGKTPAASAPSAEEMIVIEAGPSPKPISPPVVEIPPVAATTPPTVLVPNQQGTQDIAPPNIEGLRPEEIVAAPENSEPMAQMPKLETAQASPQQPMKTAVSIGGTETSPGDTPVVWGRPSFLIRPVKGAPGDGNKALDTALRVALHGKDLTVTDDPRQAGYEVVGTVDVGPPVNGRQRARIAWAVKTISGDEVGKAVQENVIAAGSLNGAWGQVADIVTAAAADGIQRLFEAPRPKYTPVGSVPAFPNVPTLPRVPGRALPPPPS